MVVDAGKPVDPVFSVGLSSSCLCSRSGLVYQPSINFQIREHLNKQTLTFVSLIWYAGLSWTMSDGPFDVL